MSFILDALRKSERDRQTQQGPSVYYAVEAEPQRKAPPWALAIIVLLALVLVVLVVNWFRASTPEVQIVPAAAPVTVAETRRPNRPVRSLSTEAEAASPPPIAPPRPDPEFTAAAPASARAQPVTPQQTAPETTRTASTPTLPSYAEVEAQGLALPDMNLDVHVYSDDPGQRFVFLNGAKYKEGETTRDGPRVIEIVDQGVVLDYQSRRFLLPWE